MDHLAVDWRHAAPAHGAEDVSPSAFVSVLKKSLNFVRTGAVQQCCYPCIQLTVVEGFALLLPSGLSHSIHSVQKAYEPTTPCSSHP